MARSSIKVTPALAKQLGLVKRPAPRSAFKKGNPGGGRKKGIPNKITSDMKAAVMEAFNKLGGSEYLVRIGKSKAPANKRAMVSLFGKMIPMQVTGEDGGAIIIHVGPEDKDA